MIKQSFTSFFWFVISALIGFGFQIFAASYLGATDFGKANYYYGFSSTIMVFACFGVQFFLPKYMHTLNKDGNLFSETFWTISALYCIIAPISAFLLKETISLPLIIIIILISYLMVIFEVIRSYYVGLSKTDRGFFLVLLFRILNVVLFIIAVNFFIQGYLSYLVALLFAYCLLVLPYTLSKIALPRVNFAIIRYCIPFYMVQISYGLFGSLSRVLQGYFGTFESVAVLSIALVLGTATGMLGDVFAKVVMPDFAKAWDKKNYENIKYAFHKVTRLNAYLVLPIAVFTIMNGDFILAILGKGYEGGYIIFSLILISSFFSSFVGPNGTLLNMTGNQRFEIINGIIGLIAALIIGFWLGPIYMWGIAFAIMFAEIVRNSAKLVEVGTLFNIWPFHKNTFIFIIFLLFVDVIIMFILKMYTSGLILLLTSGIAILLSYVLTFYAAPDEEDRRYVGMIKKELLKIFYSLR
ncbi:lipopolysaccharide biosynthesis protein [Methanogenium organophilum]|uniref:Lipopolysaccharide biosynthesis protein n=1 Tax=Methanogenium organophilum TaxID=2199 RepID=A0A9X9S315_METOG|nr:lipopolysaccharide biosynthesis protein [Methanogenium organophilum]WAI00842.1 lipopolysaccharide biosynthesis protein [Methanogenium organophilum]